MIRFIFRLKNAILSRLMIVMNTMKYLLCYMIPYVKKKEIWLLCERGTDARDNGYAFYQYMIKNHPEVQLYYLIDFQSADYEKVAQHAIAYGSWKNFWILSKADRIISTHCYKAFPGVTEGIWRAFHLDQRFYFLQHGIIQSKLPYLYGGFTDMKLFCCAATPEYEYIKENYYHPIGVVQCTGLARYDYLLPFETKKQILIMPTWRRYLRGEDNFLKSEYFARWQKILTDSRLIKYLEDTRTKLIFYPHYELQLYLKCFISESKQVVLADFQHYDVQQLLKESKLLVTDYSSVCFDFAYMRKPSIYYQFDQEEYHKQHYKEGYFSFVEHGFGSVKEKHEDLIDEILRCAENQYNMEPLYEGRTNSFFAYHDQNNCERIYQAIIQTDRKR